MARRIAHLEMLQQEIPTKSHIGHIDIANPAEAIEKTQAMINEIGGLDLIILNAGIGFLNSGLDWEKEKQTIEVPSELVSCDFNSL